MGEQNHEPQPGEVCEVCGKPATCWASDYYTTNADGGNTVFAGYAMHHAYCHEHNQPPEQAHLDAFWRY